jgi:transcriptional regulator with XRE-family HTH domain
MFSSKMNPDSSQINKERLHNLMQQVGIADLNELSQVAKVARLQLIRIQQGLILNLSLGTIAQIAQALNVSVDSLLQTFVEQPQVSGDQAVTSSQQGDALIACRQEYQKLQQEMTQLQQTLLVEFQQAS